MLLAFVDRTPLGAGGHSVRLHGLERGGACDLYQPALDVHVPDGRFVIEQTPGPDADGVERGSWPKDRKAGVEVARSVP